MSTPYPGDTPELRAQLDARLARVQASKKDAIDLLNDMAHHVTGRIITNRHPGSDHWHLEIDQQAARELLQALTDAKAQGWDEGLLHAEPDGLGDHHANPYRDTGAQQ